MNWVKKFNQLEKENTDKIIDIIVKFDEHKNNIIDDVYTKAYDLKHSIGILLDKLDVHAIVGEELKTEVERLFKIYIEMVDGYENAMDEMKKYTYTCGNKVIELNQKMMRIVEMYLRSDKDFFMMQTRMDAFTKKLINISDSLEMFDIDKEGIFQETNYMKSI